MSNKSQPTKTRPSKTNTVRKLTQRQADELIFKSKYADHVEESEITNRGYVYGLDNGKAVVVRFDGKLIAPS